MEPILKYLRDDVLPNSSEATRKLKFKAARYTLINGDLYRRSTSGLYMRCVDEEQCRHVLKELYEGDCGNHSKARSLANRISRIGYYWPSLIGTQRDMSRNAISVNGTQV